MRDSPRALPCAPTLKKQRLRRRRRAGLRCYLLELPECEHLLVTTRRKCSFLTAPLVWGRVGQMVHDQLIGRSADRRG